MQVYVDLHAFITQSTHPGIHIRVIQAVPLAHSLRAHGAESASVEDPAKARTTASALGPRLSCPAPYCLLGNAVP